MSQDSHSIWLLLAPGFIIVAQLAYVVAYRLYLSPLAKVPGPKLAALTHLYEFYYDAILEGKFTVKVDELHKQYGPVVRINPKEVHISDPDFFEKLYGGSRKLNKDPYFYRFVSTSDSSFGTSSFAIHRHRRKAYGRFFSPAAIQDREHNVRKSVLGLCERLEEFRNTGKPVMLGTCFRALATDVISQYALPRGFDLIHSKDFGEDYNNVNRKLSGVTAYNRHFPFIIPLIMMTPTWLLRLTASPGMLQMLDFQGHNIAQSKAIAESTSKSDASILHGISNSDLPASDKTAARIYQEAVTLVGAGSETTGSALEHIVYHILANPAIHRRLTAELSAASASAPDSLPTNDTLRHLPYLDTCIKEGLRLGNEVSGRLPRIDPTDPITYASYTFPPGTVVSMNIRDLHLSPLAHANPHTYDPSRFLDPIRSRTDKHFAPFGLGARACVGRDLAMLEIRLMVAALFGGGGGGKFESVDLFETRAEDVAMAHEFFSPFHRDGSPGLRVLLR